ncbi:MAG: hypothetical protein MHM6MM_004778 [Cercozoa sp. M6MM]
MTKTNRTLVTIGEKHVSCRDISDSQGGFTCCLTTSVDKIIRLHFIFKSAIGSNATFLERLRTSDFPSKTGVSTTFDAQPSAWMDRTRMQNYLRLTFEQRYACDGERAQLRLRSLVENSTHATQPCDQLFAAFKRLVRKRLQPVMWRNASRKTANGKIDRPTRAEFARAAIAAADELNTVIKKYEGLTLPQAAWAICGLGPRSESTEMDNDDEAQGAAFPVCSNLQKILDVELSQEQLEAVRKKNKPSLRFEITQRQRELVAIAGEGARETTQNDYRALPQERRSFRRDRNRRGG